MSDCGIYGKDGEYTEKTKRDQEAFQNNSAPLIEMGEPTGRGQNTNPSVPAYWGIRGPIPVVGQVDITPSLAANEVISVFAGAYNLLASTGNIVLNGVLATWELVELGIDVLDSHWDSSFTLTGNGIRQDIYTFEAVIGANPQLVAEGLACISESVRYFSTVDSAKAADKVADAAKAIDKVNDSVKTVSKPNQIHHFLSNKSSKFTKQFETITNKYGLKLDGSWNKASMPHQGRHTNKYHEFMIDKIQEFDEIAGGDKDVFLQLFDSLKDEIIKNPDMLYKGGL